MSKCLQIKKTKSQEGRTFNVARTQILSVLLQSFADVFLMLQLDEGSSCRPALPVQWEVDPRHPLTDPTL